MNTQVKVIVKRESGALSRKFVTVKGLVSKAAIAKALKVKEDVIHTFEGVGQRIETKGIKNRVTEIKNNFHAQSVEAKEKRDLRFYMVNKGTHHA
jgi:hypothetical protein